MNNADLYNELDNILWQQGNVENDIHKMAISKEEDINLDFPYLIDVEETSYSYDNEKERDEDYDFLCEMLTKNSTKYFY
jgi:hypothetical protein